MATKRNQTVVQMQISIVDQIIEQITAAYAVKIADAAAIVKAQGAVTAAKTKRDSKREEYYALLANLSVENNWTEADVNKAAEVFVDSKSRDELGAKPNDAEALKKYNAKQRTFSSFANDCARVMHPKVRERWPAIIKQANNLFTAPTAKATMQAADLPYRAIHYAMKNATLAKDGKLPVGYETKKGSEILAIAKKAATNTDIVADQAVHVLKMGIKRLEAALAIAGNTTLSKAIADLKALTKDSFKAKLPVSDGTDTEADDDDVEVPAPTPKKTATKTTTTTTKPAANVIPQDALDALLNNAMLQANPARLGAAIAALYTTK